MKKDIKEEKKKNISHYLTIINQFHKLRCLLKVEISQQLNLKSKRVGEKKKTMTN